MRNKEGKKNKKKKDVEIKGKKRIKKEKSGDKKNEKCIEEIKYSTFVSLEKCHVYCYLRNYGNKYSFYFRLSNILKTKNCS